MAEVSDKVYDIARKLMICKCGHGVWQHYGFGTELPPPWSPPSPFAPLVALQPGCYPVVGGRPYGCNCRRPPEHIECL